MLVRRFVQDRRGAVAPIFAISIVTLVGVTGAAIDYSRANATRTSMQNALDAAGLALAKEADGLSDAALGARASALFASLVTNTAAANAVVTSELRSPHPGTYNLRLVATGSVGATFTKLLGQGDMTVAATSEITWGIKKLELALVLDNTGSMAQNGKLPALKSAAHNLLTTLEQAAKKPGDIKVAIVPFDTMVNVGTGYAAQSWLDYSVKKLKPETWNGCVIDRDQPNDALDTAPTTANVHTLFPAAACKNALASMMPLSESWTALHNKVDAMTAAGNTNITIGLAWGWHALTPSSPLTEAASPQSDLDKVIVLLTDGQNTQNRWTTSSSSIDARTAQACTNIKATNVKIYTIRVIDGDAALLRGCATKPDMYYNVQQADQLSATFKSIAQSLATLRVAK